MSEIDSEEFHKLMRQAAHKARRAKPPWLDTQDLTQAATLAFLEAERKGRPVETITDPLHIANKTRERLWGAMMDTIRNAWDGTRKNPRPPAEQLPVDDDGVPIDHSVAPDNPVRTLQLKMAIEKFARKGSARQKEAVTLTAAGYDDSEVATIMGIGESRVSQLKKEARVIMASTWADL